MSTCEIKKKSSNNRREKLVLNSRFYCKIHDFLLLNVLKEIDLLLSYFGGNLSMETSWYMFGSRNEILE
jgi:hypothetical protein